MVNLSTYAAGRLVKSCLVQIYDIDCYCRSEAMCSVIIITTTEEASHVDFFLGLFFLLFGLSGGGTTGSGSTSGGSTSSGSSGDGDEELSDILSSEGLGEKSGPVRLNGVSGSLDHLVELVSLVRII